MAGSRNAITVRWLGPSDGTATSYSISGEGATSHALHVFLAGTLRCRHSTQLASNTIVHALCPQPAVFKTTTNTQIPPIIEVAGADLIGAGTEALPHEYDIAGLPSAQYSVKVAAVNENSDAGANSPMSPSAVTSELPT